MGELSPGEVRAVIERTRARLGAGSAGVPPAPATSDQPTANAGSIAGGTPALPGGRPRPSAPSGIFPTIDAAVEAAWEAYLAYHAQGLDIRHAVIDAIRAEMRTHARALAEMAQQETGLGRAQDKTRKNLLVTERTPGPEDLAPETRTGDHGMVIIERAPYGLIAAITPTTNPTATIINNAIAIVAAGNAVVFNVHPNAKRVSAEAVRLINRAIVSAGGPPNLVTAIPEPTIATAQALMRHPRVRVLLVTGGPGVVREALATDKKVIAAGPGNPPVVVDATADIELAARGIVTGASFDNNVICTDEKEVFAVASVADALLRAMVKCGAYLLKEYQLRQVERLIFSELGPPGKPGKINPAWIGQDAARILAQIGVRVGDEVRLVVADVPLEHSLVWTEQMLPVLPVVRVPDVDAAIDLAIRAEHRFGHTASIYSRDVDAITRMARAINVSIFVANGPNTAGLGEGGEGFTSFSIASPTGEGMTRPRTFTRERRLTLVGALRVV